MLPLMLLVTALTLLLSTLLRSRGTTGGIVAAFIVASYFANTLSAMAEAPLNSMRYASVFNYYNGSRVLLDGVDWGGFVLLSALTIILVALSLVTFQRRDLNV